MKLENELFRSELEHKNSFINNYLQKISNQDDLYYLNSNNQINENTSKKNIDMANKEFEIKNNRTSIME